MTRFITFTSDFGLGNGYVASVKAVLLSSLPETILLDITHAVPVFSPLSALPPLLDILDRTPRGSLHLVVVDPGVGSSRRALLGISDAFRILAPDNGLPRALSQWKEGLTFIDIRNLDRFGGRASATFQGRDLFAPAAVYLEEGGNPELLGPKISTRDLARTDGPSPGEGALLVTDVDRFGNILLGFHARKRPDAVAFMHGGILVPYVSRYQEVERGHLGILVNSSGWLEIFCREGSAARLTGIPAGAIVPVRIEGGEGRYLA